MKVYTGINESGTHVVVFVTRWHPSEKAVIRTLTNFAVKHALLEAFQANKKKKHKNTIVSIPSMMWSIDPEDETTALVMTEDDGGLSAEHITNVKRVK